MTFECCKNLKSIEISDGVEYIGKKCFSFSGIEEITISGTLKGINDDAFADCESLKIVWLEEESPINIERCVSGSVEILPVKVKRLEMKFHNLRK